LDDLEREANGSFGPLVDNNGNLLATSAGKTTKPPMRTPFSQTGGTLALNRGGMSETASGSGDGSRDSGGAMMQLTADMLAYSKVVQEMTTSTRSVDGSSANDMPTTALMDQFESAAASIGDTGDGSGAHVTQLWQVAKHLVGRERTQKGQLQVCALMLLNAHFTAEDRILFLYVMRCYGLTDDNMLSQTRL
jgi:hypothetical protein